MNGLQVLLDEVNAEVTKQIDSKTQEVVADVKKQLDELKQFQPTVVVSDGKELGKLEGLQHKQLTQLVKLIGANLNVLLVGMAGTGKTHSAKQVADAVGFNFYAMSVGSQTSKSDLVGYMDAHGNYVTTAFRKAYEQGGIFVLDEIDAGNSNVLIILNSALSNGMMNFPDKMVERHEDFRFVATANTYGNGADRTYVGRNQLDGATLDRFTVLDWQIDEGLEGKMVSGYSYGKAWFETVREVRRQVDKSGIRALITPRATQKGATVLELGMDGSQAIEVALLPQIPQDKRSEYMQNAFKLLSENMKKYPKLERKDIPESTEKAQEAPLEGEVIPAPTTEAGTVTSTVGGKELRIVTDARGRTRYYLANKLTPKAEIDKLVAAEAETTTTTTEQPKEDKADFDFDLPY